MTMNNENEIEEMLKIVNEATADCKVCAVCKFRINGDCCNRKVGEYLQNAGIGDKKKSVKEFAEKLKDIVLVLSVGTEMDGSNLIISVSELFEIIDNQITKLR